MPLASWFRPPRHTLAVFLCLMLISGGALGWLGWRVLRQDRSLERQRVQERLEQAADHVAAALQENLSDLGNYLSLSPSQAPKVVPADVAVLVEDERAVNIYPPGRLLYYPAVADGQEPPATAYAEGESLEFRQSDPAKAADVFRVLAHSPNAELRAGALLRLGRNLRKLGRHQGALQVYGELAQLGSTRVLGLPAELVAREARCTVLEAMGRRDELRKEALLMYEPLRSGRWSLLRPAWEFHVEEARRWADAGSLPEPGRGALVLSRAAEEMHGQWLREPESSGRRIQTTEGQPVLLLWTAAPGRRAAVLAGPGYLNAMWQEALREQRAQAALVAANGQVVLGSLRKDARQAVRTADATRLPWTLYVASSIPTPILSISSSAGGYCWPGLRFWLSFWWRGPISYRTRLSGNWPSPSCSRSS